MQRPAASSLLCLVVLVAGVCRAGESRSQLVIFHAGSLAAPFERIIEGFKRENPGVEVLKEIAVSRECARKISELHKPCDILASSDYMVIDTLLVPEFADWNLKFAANEMTVVYGPKSRHAREVSPNLSVGQEVWVCFKASSCRVYEAR